MAQGPVPAGEVSDLLPLKPHPLQYSVHEDEVAECSVTQGGSVVLLSCGPRLLSYSTHNGRLCNIWGFGDEAPKEPRVGPWVLLTHAERYYVVAAVDGDGVSPDLLCVCHVLTSKVIKAIRMPSPVTSICVVDDGNNPDALAGSSAAYMGGCIAVATRDAQVFLVDLCMNKEKYSSEESPASLKFVDGAPPAGNAHGAVFVCDQESFFENVSEAGDIPGGVDVTCLEYFPQLDCLGVGLSSGTVYLWRILTGSLMLSLNASRLPVVGLMLQEPENDPRRWCYLWVVSGAKKKKRCDCVTSCAMFSLDFGKKFPLDSYRFFYEGFSSCHQVFECALGPYLAGPDWKTVGPSDISSRLVSCRTMLQAEVFHSRGSLDVSDLCHAIDRQHDLNLMLLSWELLQGGRSLGTYLTVFDINQWYHAQMPPIARPGHFCSYLGVFSLKAVGGQRALQHVMDVYVVPRSVTKFSSWSTGADQTRFPSSLLLKCTYVTDGGIVHVTFRGLQRQLLHNLSQWGPDCLVSPNKLYLECCCLGLLNHELSGPLLDTFVPSVRKALLSMALDNRLLGFLNSCINHWADSDSQDASDGGLKLTFFVEWAWDRVKENKASIDKLCVPLFDGLGHEMSLASLQRLGFISRDMTALLALFKRCSSLTSADIDLESLALREEVAERVGQYVRVVMFLVNCGVLPEDDEGSANVCYPAAFLKQWYHQARKTSTLLIDVLMEVMFGGSASPWGEPYPAPTLQEALTGIFLMHDLPPWGPHGLLLYLLLDLASVLLESHPQVAEALKEFPFLFSLNPSLESLVQGCWHLDHSLYDRGLDLLLEAWAATGLSHLKDALSRPILRLLSENGKAKHALHFLDYAHFPAPHTDPELLSLHLDVLLADQRVMEALHLVRESGNPAAVEELFERIITASKPEPGDGSLFGQLIEQQLSASEESALEDRLRREGELRGLGKLAFHWLREGRTRDAVRVAAALRELLQRGGTGVQPSGERNPMLTAVLALVDGVAAMLPMLPYPSGGVRPAVTDVVHLATPLQVLPKKAGKRDEYALTPALQFAVETSRAPRKTHLTPFRQDVVYPRYEETPSVESSRRSWGDGDEPPAKTPRIMDGTSRRSGVPPQLLEEALSVLRTPPVKRGGSLGSSVIVSRTPPPSILKLRSAGTGLEIGGSVEEASPPPTPLLLPEASSTPDAATRKLRFAVADSSPSEVSFLVTDGSRLTDLDASIAPSEFNQSTEETSGRPEMLLSSDQMENSGQASFMTADGGNSDDENFATELETSCPPLSKAWAGEQEADVAARSVLGSPKTISLPSRAVALQRWSTSLHQESVALRMKGEFSPNETGERHSSKDGINVDSSPEIIYEEVVTAMHESEGNASEVETVVISSSSSEKSMQDTSLQDFAHQHEQQLAIGSAAAEGNSCALAEPDILTRQMQDAESETPLAEAGTAAAVPETPLDVAEPLASAVPEWIAGRETEASSDDESSEGTPLKDSEPAETQEQQPHKQEDKAPVSDAAFQHKEAATILPRRLFPAGMTVERLNNVGVEENRTPLVPICPSDYDQPEMTDLADGNLVLGTLPLHAVDKSDMLETMSNKNQKGEEEGDELSSPSHPVIEGSELLHDVESCEGPERNMSEEIRNRKKTPMTRRARRSSEASDDSVSGHALMFYDMAAPSESSVSLPGSEPDEMPEALETKQKKSPERAGSGMVTRRRSMLRSLPASAPSSPQKCEAHGEDNRAESSTLKLPRRPASSLSLGRNQTGEGSKEVQPRTRRRSGSLMAAEGSPHVDDKGSARTDGLHVRKSGRKLLSPHGKLSMEKIAMDVVNATSQSLRSTPSEPEAEDSMGNVSEKPALETEGQKGRRTPKKNVRARSEPPPDVRTVVTRGRSGTALAQQTPEHTPSKLSETPQSSRKRKQSPDGIETEGTVVMELRSRSASELSTKERPQTPRKTPVNKLAQLPPTGSPSLKKERRSSTPVSPSRRSTRVTPMKPGSPMPSTGAERAASTEDDVRRQPKRLLLDTIPEAEVNEGIETVSPALSGETSSGSLSPGRTQRRLSSRIEARRKSLRLMETIPEGEAGGSEEGGLRSGLRGISPAKCTAETTEEQPSRLQRRGSRSPEAKKERAEKGSSQKERPRRTTKKESVNETLEGSPKKGSPERELPTEESQKKTPSKKEPPKAKLSKKVTPQKELRKPEPSKEESVHTRSPKKSPKMESTKKKSKEVSKQEVSETGSGRKGISKADLFVKESPEQSPKKESPTKETTSKDPSKGLSKIEPAKTTPSRKEASKVGPHRKKSPKESPTKVVPKVASPKKTPKKDSPKEKHRKKQAGSKEPLKKELPEGHPLKDASPTSERQRTTKSLSPRKESPARTSLQKENFRGQEDQQKMPDVSAESTSATLRKKKVKGTEEATPTMRGRSLKRKLQRAEQGDADSHTFQLASPAVLGDKSVVIPPEAETREFVFSPPVTRHQRSLLQESNASGASVEPSPAELKAGLSASPSFQAPPSRPSRRSSLGVRKGGAARPPRPRSSASTVSAKLVNRSKLRRSMRLPLTPRSSSSSSAGSPGSPWTIVNPKGRH